jgi:apolipoprotein N-acyltransferase
VAFTPQIGRCVPFVVGVGGPPDVMRRLGLKLRMDARDYALQNYAIALTGTPVFSHITFALIAILALYPLLRRRRPEDIAIAFMLIGAFVFTLSFFVISIACDYRYLYALDLSAMFAAFYVALNPELLSVYWRRREWR